ncbi:MAG TPA: ATP-binding cassette domain-containing protein, partial [Anaerolineales bacterium]|nr:ATP-binding cassette domain-containing protein [Anaerolineales bacterium]
MSNQPLTPDFPQPETPTGAAAPMLAVKDIHTYYGNIHALKGVSLTVQQGEIVTLIGGNGAGKTTTLRSICGLNKPRSGLVILEGENLANIKAHEIVYKGVAMVP